VFKLQTRREKKDRKENKVLSLLCLWAASGLVVESWCAGLPRDDPHLNPCLWEGAGIAAHVPRNNYKNTDVTGLCRCRFLLHHFPLWSLSKYHGVDMGLPPAVLKWASFCMAYCI